MGIHNRTYYNPETNEISRRPCGDGFFSCGSRKFAEAMTTVDPEERPLVWRNSNYGTIDVKNLNSKLRHKLARIGIREILVIPKYTSPGYSLLKKILSKKK